MEVINTTTIGGLKHQPKKGWKLLPKAGGQFGDVQISNHLIAKHVLNLRKHSTNSLITPVKAVTIEPIIENKLIKTVKTDLSINLMRPKNYVWCSPWYKLEKKWPLLRGLTINFIVEILLWLSFISLRFIASVFHRLYIQTSQIIRSILLDLIYFLNLLARASSFILFPWRWRQKNWQPRWQFALPTLSQLAVFILVVAIIIAPIKLLSLLNDTSRAKGQIENYAEAAFTTFTQASNDLLAGNYSEAREGFLASVKVLNQATAYLDQGVSELNYLLKNNLFTTTAHSAEALIGVGKEISEVGIILSHTFDVLDNQSTSALTEIDLATKTAILKQAMVDIQPKVQSINQLLNDIDVNSLPVDMAPKILALKNILANLEITINDLAILPNFFQQLIPSTGEKVYLFIFQNYSELRPTGGFLGSLAFVHLTDGKISKIDIPGGGPYDFQGQLKNKIKAPLQLSLINPLWQLQDSNWFFDFPTSARTINWFLDQSGAVKCDGVISFNPDVIIELLQLTGPIELTKYNKIITADNFIRETQEAVDLEYDRVANRPKEFIADLTPLLLDKMMSLPSDKKLALYQLLNDKLITRSIQMNFNDANLQKMVTDLGWSGQIEKTSGDYLAIVRTNIGGGKSDLVINESISHKIFIQNDGSLIAQVDLTREHLGDKLDIFYSRQNSTWLKFYVPLGSELIAADGFDKIPESDFKLPPSEAITIDTGVIEQLNTPINNNTTTGQQFDKTFFAGWLKLSPGEKKTVTIKYRLPFNLFNFDNQTNLYKYQVLFQNQSGVLKTNFHSQLTSPDNFEVKWIAGPSGTVTRYDKETDFSSRWDRDLIYSVLLQKKN